MEEKPATLGTVPEALAKREKVVILADGSSITVYKWSRQKFPEMIVRVGLLAEVHVVAEQSVADADRERVRGLEFEDQLEIATAAGELNMTPTVLKNLPALLKQRRGLEEALVPKAPTENPKAPSSQS